MSAQMCKQTARVEMVCEDMVEQQETQGGIGRSFLLPQMNRCVPSSVVGGIKNAKSVWVGRGPGGVRADDGEIVPGSRSGTGVEIQYPPLDVENIHPWRRWAGEDSQPGPGAPAGAT